jgi:curved DNA-binding protein CbpA
MSPAPSILAMFHELDRQSYYDLLGVAPNADVHRIKASYQRLAATCHPDAHRRSSPEERSAAGQVFKRIVEAYRVLSGGDSRLRYDRALAQGKLRIDPLVQDAAPPSSRIRTLETLAVTPSAKQFARAADKLIGEGKLKEAKMQVMLALNCDGDNAELAERLNMLQETLALMGS